MNEEYVLQSVKKNEYVYQKKTTMTNHSRLISQMELKDTHLSEINRK